MLQMTASISQFSSSICAKPAQPNPTLPGTTSVPFRRVRATEVVRVDAAPSRVQR
jgi:hypothetical protein